MKSNVTDLIFENYDRYLVEHRDEIGSPSGAIEMLTSDGAFRAYMAALTEGLEPYQKAAVMGVCERQREFLLEESVQLGPSASIIGYAVTYFPILTDIYADPVISQVATVYPTSKSMITIPKVQLSASVKNTDGTTSKYTFPRATHLVRGAAENLNLLPNVSNNLFELSAGFPTGNVNSTLSRINKRYFMVTTIEVFGDTGGASDTTTLVALNVRPDARGQIHKEFSFMDAEGRVGQGSMIGHIDWDGGNVQYSVSYSPNPACTFSTNFCTSKVLFSPKTGETGRVKVELKISGWDVNIDTHEDFEIELQTETIN